MKPLSLRAAGALGSVLVCQAAIATPICAPTDLVCPPARVDSPPVLALTDAGVSGVGFYAATQGDFDGDGVPDFAGTSMGGAGGGSSDIGVAVYLSNGAGGFRSVRDYPAGSYPIGVLAVGLRGAGAPLDLLVADAGPNAAGRHDLSLLRGRGDGSFAAPQAVADFPYEIVSLASGDFNRDGKPDLAVGTSTDIAGQIAPQELAILIGRGDGTFGPPQPQLAGDGASHYYDLHVGDFNGDGRLDVMGMDPVGLWLSIGNGDGSFAPAALVWADPTTYFGVSKLLGGPAAFTVEDFNGDGRSDAALLIYGARVDVLLGTPAGALVPAPTPTYDISASQTGQGGGTLQTADVDGDGHADLLAATGYGATLALLRGRGDGSFTAPVIHPLPSADDRTMLVGDLDRDGDVDATVFSGWYPGGAHFATLLRNPGDGRFPLPASQPVIAPFNRATQTNAVGVALGDLDADGRPDLVVTQWDLPIEPQASGQMPRPPKVDPEALTIDNGGTVAVLLGQGDGGFATEQQYLTGSRPIAAAIASLTGDGKADVVVASAASRELSLLKGHGDGGFDAAIPYALAGLPNALAVADFNGDGLPDVAVTELDTNDVAILLNGSTSGHIGLQAAQRYATAVAPNAIVATDLDGDGHLDLAIAGYGDSLDRNSPSVLTVLRGRGDGRFTALPPLTLWPGPGADALVAADLDGGAVDLAVANFDRGEVLVLSGRGDGSFVVIGRYAAGYGSQGMVATDINGDGLVDLAVSNLNDNTVAFLAGAGGGRFVAARDGRRELPVAFGWPAFAYPTFLASDDLDGDGRPDLVTGNLFLATATVLHNTSPVAQPPLAQLAAAGAVGMAPLDVAFDASASRDPNTDGPVGSFRFDFGDGTPPVTQSSPLLTHRYAVAGHHAATVTALAHGKSGQSTPVDASVQALTFAGRTGVSTFTWVNSAPVILGGLRQSAPIDVANGQYRINGGAWTNQPATVQPGDAVSLRNFSSGAAGTARTTTVSIGGAQASFRSVTGVQDRTPDGFRFAPVADAAPRTLVQSAAVTPTGFNVAAAVVPSAGVEVRIDGGNWTGAASVLQPGQGLQLRLRSASASGGVQVGTVSVGGRLASFTVHTR